MYRLPPMNWLRSFEAAARRQSFTAAAEELNRTPAAVSHHVRALEAHLGFPMFERLGHGLRLTDMGRAYLPAVRKAFEDLSTSTAGLFGTMGSRSITIRTTISFAVLWLAPRLWEFREACPDIDVRLLSAVWADALSPDHLDLEIRLGAGSWAGYRAEPITTETAIPVCSKATFETHGPYRSVEDFRNRELIHIMGLENLWIRFFSAHDAPATASVHGFTVDTSLVAIELAAVGEGHAMLLDSFTQSPVFTSRLVRLWDQGVSLDHRHYLLVPESDGQLRPEVLLFREWLLDAGGRRLPCPA